MQTEDLKIIKLVFVNAFLIKVKDGFVLIDTGISTSWKKLEKVLKSAGALPDKIKLVIATHGDFDHIGNCAKLQKEFNCKIAIHANDVIMAKEHVEIPRKMRGFSIKFFSLIVSLAKNKFYFDCFQPDIILYDGQNLSEYGLNATVLNIPGHTKGSIGILTDVGNLFSGDVFINRSHPDTAVYIENEDELKQSYARLKTLNIKTVYPGHGKTFEMNEISGKI